MVPSQHPSGPLTVMITGATSGIGRAAVPLLAARGARVVMVCRDRQRGQAVLEEVKGNLPSASVDLMVADLSCMADIVALVRDQVSRLDGVDVLINNAALFDLSQGQRHVTPEGHETFWATNYLGPFLLTNLLMARGPLRVLNIGSKGLMAQPLLRLRLEDPGFEHAPFRVTPAYYHAKLALLTFTRALARRYAPSIVSVHALRVPAVQLDAERLASLPWHLRLAYAPKRRFALEPEAVARVYADLVASPELAANSGYYVDVRGRTVKWPAATADEEVQDRLWATSAKLTGLDTLVGH